MLLGSAEIRAERGPPVVGDAELEAATETDVDRLASVADAELSSNADSRTSTADVKKSPSSSTKSAELDAIIWAEGSVTLAAAEELRATLLLWVLFANLALFN